MKKMTIESKPLGNGARDKGNCLLIENLEALDSKSSSSEEDANDFDKDYIKGESVSSDTNVEVLNSS
mgnify:CR=1 FL=1